MKFFHAFGLAVQFLTRLPVPPSVRYSPQALGWSVVFYPLVGLLIGALLLLLRGFLGEAGPLLGSALLLTAWVMVTGGLHLDGLADCADAWAGGRDDKERSLRVMKDPCSGPVAVVTVVLLLLLKFSALAELPGPAAVWPLLGAPLVGRGLVPLLLLSTPYVRPGGLGSPLLDKLPRFAAGFSAAFALLCAGVLLGPWALLAVVGMAWWLRRLALRRLGGCTGDVLGASIEIAEAVALVVAALA